MTGRTRLAADGPVVSDVLQRVWVLAVAGIAVGVVVAGIGGRLAMLVLRLTSPDSVRGVRSDDGFTIGRVTLGGTYSLLLLGAVVGVIGAAAYRAVAPWLLGPAWFRRATVAMGSGAVVGSMVVHADGVDFVVLEPVWLAVGLFVALPAAFGAVIAVVVDRVVASPELGRRHWVVAGVLVALFPLALVPLALAAVLLTLWAPVRRRVKAGGGVPRPVGGGIRTGWLSVAVLGLLALIRDVQGVR